MAHNAAPTQKLRGNEWRVLGTLVPYLLEYKWRVALALACLITAKLANVGVPLVMKEVVDRLEGAAAIVAVPVALLATYGILRFSTTMFGELPDELIAMSRSPSSPSDSTWWAKISSTPMSLAMAVINSTFDDKLTTFGARVEPFLTPLRQSQTR